MLWSLVYDKTTFFAQGLVLVALLMTLAQAISLLWSVSAGLVLDYWDFVNVLIRFCSAMLYLVIPYRVSLSRHDFERFMHYVVLLALFACAFNLAANFRGIFNILSITNAYAVSFRSFYTNRNAFGQLLFLAIVANTVVLHRRSKVVNLAIYFVLGVNLLATLSRTSMGAVLVFVLVYIALAYPRRILPLLLVCTSGYLVISANERLLLFITQMLLRTDVGTTARSTFWRVGLGVLNGFSWVVGIGSLTSRKLLQDLGLSSQFHSFFVETLVGGGVVDIALHSLCFAYVLKRVRSCLKYDRLTGLCYTAAYVALLSYISFESVSFFSMGYVDVLFSLFFITVPLLYGNTCLKRPDPEVSHVI
jgi:hypothetical protein